MAEVGKETNARLSEILPRKDQRPEVLHEAMRYAVLGGGKRIRPVVTLAAFHAAAPEGAGREKVLDAGCAVELLHAYSLVHDDLPAMDNDALRRNRLTCHKAFGEATAILVGDALQCLAFDVMAQAGGDKAEVAIRELAQASGSLGMVGGQMLDMEGEGKHQDVQEIELIDRWKTGALITACSRLGGIFAGASDARLERLTQYGRAIGFMYQICDDILDTTATSQQLGKATRKDDKAGKLTYPGALGEKEARAMAQKRGVEAQQIIREFGKEGLYLRLLCDYLLDRIS
jgi:geranylgeranyl pyrophosphate synthase